MAVVHKGRNPGKMLEEEKITASCVTAWFGQIIWCAGNT
jgi:hypothetical protein